MPGEGPTMEDLRREYFSVRIGENILAELNAMVASVTRRYEPRTYGRVDTWTEDARNDITQDVVTRLLLGERQLDYLMSVSLEIGDFRRLLAFQVRRLLARSRTRTVIDNLLDRAKPILLAATFASEGSGAAARYWLDGAQIERRDALDGELLTAARTATIVPRTHSISATERAPAVYTGDRLRSVVFAVAEQLPCWFTLHDLAAVFEMLLTDWTTSVLGEDDAGDETDTAALTPEDEALVASATDDIVRRCTNVHLKVLRGKLQGSSDQAIATSLGVSRPTVIARKQEIYGFMRIGLEELPDRVQQAIMIRLSDRLSAVEGGDRS